MVNFIGADLSDIPLIRSLAQRIWQVSYRGLLSPEQIEYMLAWMYSEDAIRRDLTEGILYELIHDEGEAVGYLSLGAESRADWKLHKLYVLPESQGCGLGQQALRHACTLASARGAQRLALNVNKQNTRAIRAYERAGFRIVESVVNDIGGGFVMDDFVMRRELPLPV